MSSPLRILVLAHNHPDLQPGGTEVVARNLFRFLCDSTPGVEGLFLAAVTASLRDPKPGTLLQGAPGGHADEALIRLPDFDRFFLSQIDTHGLVATLGPLMDRLRPDIIHIHHPLQFGVETIAVLRRLAPRRAKIVLTLHDYFAICPREGQLLTTEGRLCPGPSLDACRRCLPNRSGTDLMLRQISLRDACNSIDALLAPSQFLKERFVAAGWDARRISVLPNAVPTHSPPVAHRPLAPGGRRDRFAFFGHINRFKGSLVALDASARLSKAGVAHKLSLHGGTAYQPEAFLEEFNAALASAPAARHHGAYAAADLPTRMGAADWVVVPSIWYENAPLVILEALHHRRPVICGDAGGMAELVRPGLDGLHAPIGDAEGWAEVLERAASEPDLWHSLVETLQAPSGMEVMAAAHLDFYRRLLRPAPACPAAVAA